MSAQLAGETDCEYLARRDLEELERRESDPSAMDRSQLTLHIDWLALHLHALACLIADRAVAGKQCDPGGYILTEYAAYQAAYERAHEVNRAICEADRAARGAVA